MKMKRKIQFGVLGVLIIGIVYFLSTNNKATIKPELRNFNVEDTSKIDKIFLVDKMNKSILLEKKQSYWELNNAYEARTDLVNLLLKTIYRMRVMEPVSNAASKAIIKNLAVKSTKVELYKKGKLDKVFYVGGPTQNSQGTFMIMEGSSKAFIIEMPGFRGYLSTRFSTNEMEWRTQRVFNYGYNDVLEVIFNNYENEKQSFILKKEGALYSIFENATMNKFPLNDTLKAKAYIASLRNKNFSKYVDDIPQEWKDSILATTPMYSITVINTEGNEQSIDIYKKPAWGKLDGFGEVLKEDPDHFFIEMDTKDFVYGQYFVFDPLFKELQDFSN